ncbi:ergosterol biosynthesis protein [Pleosporales sp. CAS-2024a]
MASTAAPSHVYLQYFVLSTAILGFVGHTSTLVSPSTFGSNFTPKHRPSFTPLAARSLGAWFLTCSILRFGAWFYWGEKGWYDVGMLSLVLPIWHYSLEKAVWGSVKWKQLGLAWGLDGLGLIWMLKSRADVLGL